MKRQIDSIILTDAEGVRLRIYKLVKGDYCFNTVDGDNFFSFTKEDVPLILSAIEIISAEEQNF